MDPRVGQQGTQEYPRDHIHLGPVCTSPLSAEEQRRVNLGVLGGCKKTGSSICSVSG